MRNCSVFLSVVCVSVVLSLLCATSHSQAANQSSIAAFTNTRHVYERGEKCSLRLNAAGAQSVEFDVDGLLPFKAEVKGGVAEYPIDTALLRAQDYTVHARVAMADGQNAVAAFPFTVARQHDAERIPVWRWGYADPDWWESRGFTGGFISARKDPATPGDLDAAGKQFDKATQHDFELGLYVYPLLSERWAGLESARSLLPNGTRHEKACPLEPAVMEHAKAVAESWTNGLAEYPGFRHVMLQSEWQQPFCVNDVVAKMCEDETGLDIREFLNEKGGLKGFDASTLTDGLIDDNHPRYRFLQWWWQRGHGTAPMNEVMHAAVKARRSDVMTWHEPYRLAPVRYSHKGLDCIGTWTYGYPDIKRLAYTTYLQAAARPEHQRVQQDITLFVYGRFVMPLNESTADFSKDFAGEDPFFTAGPDYAREAMWLVVSQRPDILCFYSAGKLSPEKEGQNPLYASPETFDAIGEVCNELVKPFGPTILACSRVNSNVALLMSAAATWFNAGDSWPGYPNEQTLPYAALLMMNHVPFDVLLDEDIAKGALAYYTTLVMPRASTLTRGVHAKIIEFVQKGGAVIADASLRASVPGAVITKYDMTYQERINGKALVEGNAVTAEEDRATMEVYAKDLAALLVKVPREIDAASPRVLTNSIECGAARYHFYVNDDRTYGRRFGQWKLQFELGVPQKAEVSVAVGERPVLYDVLQRKRIEYENREGRGTFNLELPAARGALVAALPEPIARVTIDAPQHATLGKPVTCVIRVVGETGKPIDAALPLQIDVIDPAGQKTEWRRYTTTKAGEREFAFTPAINDAKGVWSVRVTDLVAGVSAEAKLACEG